MRQHQRFLIGVAMLLLVRAAALAPAAPSPSTRAPRTEIEWQIVEIARDIAEMVVFAHTGRPPDAAFAVDLASSGDPSVLAVRVRTTAEAAPVVASISSSDLVAAPEPYVGLAGKLLRAHGLASKGTQKSAGAPFLEKLSDFTMEALATENVRVSTWLDREPLNPEAHDEAALLAGVLALKEESGPFWDPREATLRAAAHLALAGALRGSNTPGVTGVFARELLRAVAGDPDRAREVLRARLSGSDISAGERAWTNAIEIHGTGSWKVLEKPLTATLVERVLHFRALARNLNSVAALGFLSKRNNEPVTDWGRTALASSTTVAAGNLFSPQAMILEIAEIAEVAEIERPGALDGESNRDPSAVLKAEPARTLEVVDGKARLRALSWSLWSRYFQRHLMHAAVATHHHLAWRLRASDEARTLREGLDPLVAQLELGPLLRERLIVGRLEEDPNAETRQDPWDVDAAGLFAARSFVQSRPELATVHEWHRIGDPPGWVPIPGEWRYMEWFPAEDGPFDATRSIFAPVLAGGFSLKQVEGLAARLSHDTRVLSELMRRRHGDTPTVAQFDALYAPVLETDLNIMYARAALLGSDLAQYRRQMERIAVLDPCAWAEVASSAMARGSEEDVAAALRKLVDECEDAVLVSHRVAWLVDYLRDKGDMDEAGKLARDAAEVGSGGGLLTMARHHEARGKIEEAESLQRQLQERYGDDLHLAAFYARCHRADPGRYAAEAAEYEKKLFPRGLERVSLSDFRGPPTEGVTPRATFHPPGWPIDDGAVIGALDGYRVRNAKQYAYIRALTPGRRLLLIVWDGTAWREVSGEFRLKTYGEQIETFPQRGGRPR